MGSHRRFVSSGPAENGYLHPVESYGGWFDFTTNLREEQKAGGTLTGWLDYLVGGFEEEDIKASPTVGGVDPRTGQPVDPDAARTVADFLNQPRGGGGGDEPFACGAYPDWVPNWVKQDMLACVKPPSDRNRRLAVLVASVVAGGVLLYAAPKIIARYKK